jgi:PHD/YefM family antitoxin component YafN of YafNO toxin-antitoxin module
VSNITTIHMRLGLFRVRAFYLDATDTSAEISVRKLFPKMSIHYVTDEQGEKIAVVVPIQEWEALLGRLEDDDSLSPEEASRAEESWQEYVAGRTRTLSQVKKALLTERQD